MTTIAYRAGVMAADMQVTSGNRKLRATKARQLADGGLIAGAGNVAQLQRVMAWVESGQKAKDRPDFGEAADFECLIVRPDGSTWLIDDDLEPMRFEDEFMAIGSGCTYALAAMECGRSPEEAVHVAARFDPATSAPVQVFRIGKPKRLKK